MITCSYCGNQSDVVCAEAYHEPICGSCLEAEYKGPPTDLEFGATARFVRRRGRWFLEGRDSSGRSFFIGEIHEPTDPASPPTRNWQAGEGDHAWDVDFVANDGPHQSRRARGTTPQRCVYCGEIFEAEPGMEQYAADPGCEKCYPETQKASPETRVGSVRYQYTCRQGRFFLEGVSSSNDIVIGMLAHEPEDWNRAPRLLRDSEGRMVWDCEFAYPPAADEQNN